MVLRWMVLFVLLYSSAFSKDQGYQETIEHQKDKGSILYTNLVGAAVITAWGVANWGYGRHSPHSYNEEWFGAHTKSGGADKLGHLYASYALGSGLAGLYEDWGYSNQEASLYAAASSFFLMNYMEIGDAFSNEFGFSYEDFIMNTIGALGAYVLSTDPKLAKAVDLRVEYLPSLKTADVVTEYERMKYLLAFKAEGFEWISNPYLKYAELQIGYYTRGYDRSVLEDQKRVVYLGIGINLSRVFRKNGYRRTARFLNYYQLPYSYLPLEKNLEQ